MTKKIETIDLKGKSYATVPTRIKKFREECPNGLIDPKPTFLENGQTMFSVRVLKDKANPNSAEATGHAIGMIATDKGDKGFEKLETIATGRALALLGYMASGDVASSEEMEEFTEYQQTKKDLLLEELQEKINNIKNIDDLKTIYKANEGLGKEFAKLVTDKKAELSKK